MAPSRRSSNGRSPLVNQQRQITSFFTKSASLSPSPSPVPSKQKPNPNPSRTPSPSPSPTTPSPLNPKRKKPLLVIGGGGGASSPSPTPKADQQSYGEEVIGRRIKVYWPLDKSWYEGCVKSFDRKSNKHVVEYVDGDEETLDLMNEKIEWIRETTRNLKRLRRGSSASNGMVMEHDESGNMDVEEDKEEMGDGDDSSDEDWGKNGVVEDEEENTDTELVDDDDEEEENDMVKSKGKRGSKLATKKRKESGVDKPEPAKKSKTSVDANDGVFQVAGKKAYSNSGEKKSTNNMDNVMTSDAAERFTLRESQKLHFLGENRRDAKRRHPGDENYDSRTLYLPHDFLKSLSDGQKQWWEFKSKHMDKVLFFKMGKFYELFEMDAHIGVKELDLQYMKGEQPHCGFPERNFSMNVEKLARKGYRVLVVEQTETPEQLELRRKEKGCKDKVVKREICAIVTKGTLTEGELLSANPEASYLMALTESDQGLKKRGDRIFGVCAVDVTTSGIILGQFTDDSECSALCCILSELRPVEIIKPAQMLSAETERVLVRHTRNPLVNELIPLEEFWDAEMTIREVKRIYNHNVVDDGSNNLPKILLELVNAEENGSSAISALGGALFYLKQAFLDEALLRFAKFELLPCSGFKDFASKSYMILDAAALENLEIFENTRNGDSSGTLYSQLNHCVTAFGKRLLKAWLARPLYHLESIRERQEAVASLRGDNLPYALEYRKSLSRLPDMERLLARIFSSSEASGRNSNKVILYEDAAKKKLQEFIAALRGCETMEQACSSLGVILKNVDSKQLHQILTAGTGIPGIQSVLNEFKDAFDWAEANSTGRIIPHEGVDADYDSACKTIKDIESGLSKYLKEQRKLLGDTSITYVTIGKEAYLLEVPESLQRSIPCNYELRSSRKGFFRYWTADIKRLLDELSQAESAKESSLKSILQRLIGRFCEHHIKWRQLVSTTAELDVLISLAIASDYYEGPACCPNFSGSSQKDEVPSLVAKGLGHPVLRSDSLGKGTFVPNDISIGGPSHPSFILLTGPNMGGKSTLLRQVCLAVILAQVGVDLPAESFELSPVDRIFVRMGAKDNIMAGQSTFLTELSETASMLTSATHNSLVALDELGRGTSTSDGQAIAESVLEHFVQKIRCRGMFSTHYHRLSIHYEKSPKVSLCHMACQVSNTVEGVEEVTFLYRLTDGACPKSYGVNVARLAGLPNSLLQRAVAKSREFEAKYGNYKQGYRAIRSSSTSLHDMVTILQKIFDAAATVNCNQSVEVSHFCSVSELQREVRILLQ